MRLYMLRIIPEYFPQHCIIDKRPGITFMVKPDIPLGKLHPEYRNGRHKIPEDTLHGIHGYAPYPEKPQYVVDAESVEVIAHLLKTALPPAKSVLLHFLPVIGRKAPVLTLHCKIVRRCAGLLVHMVQAGFHP